MKNSGQYPRPRMPVSPDRLADPICLSFRGPSEGVAVQCGKPFSDAAVAGTTHIRKPVFLFH